MPIPADPKLTQNQFDSLTSSIALDMTAAFSVMEDETIKAISKAEKEGWTADELINEIGRMFEEPTDKNQDMFNNILEEN